MTKKLIIVESPSKARTLSKFLGSSFIVKASMGHVRDLPKSKIGVDVEHGYAPQYQIIKGREKSIEELRKAAKQADETYLASDPDREGEAIAWHLAEALHLKNPVRIVFHEITEHAVEDAMAHPREIDRALVAAQEARRVIDRLLGYRLSPFLWKKIRAGLSAGRVQSVAVRLVADREAEIDAFLPKESWSLEVLVSNTEGQTFVAKLIELRGEAASLQVEDKERPLVATGDESHNLLTLLGFDEQGEPITRPTYLNVEKVATTNLTRSAPAPYTTSVMQQDASTRLRYSPKRTMLIAQQLYEGIDLGSQGPVGLITYMRTDSSRIADEAKAMAHAYITTHFGASYVRTSKPTAKAKSALHVQDAHEAIRPTDIVRTPEALKSHLDPAQFRLYELIWKRFVASQMAEARLKSTRITLVRNDCVFRATGSVVEFDGFQKVWKREESADKEETLLPLVHDGDKLDGKHISAEQHFSQPPARYTEASLIKEMEEKGIGRPSTYAPTLDVIQQRRYVRQEERKLYLTELGRTVDLVLREYFPRIVDVTFTAQLEEQLDQIEAGSSQYETIVGGWYVPFEATIGDVEKSVQRIKVPVKDTGEICPQCHEGNLVIREGRFGEFVGCARFPECTYIRSDKGPAAEPTGDPCPECGKPLVTRSGRRGPFVGCSGYPTCRYVAPIAGQEGDAAAQPPQDYGKCPDCGKPLVARRSRRGVFLGCSGYPGCKHTGQLDPAMAPPPVVAAPVPVATGDLCPECGKPLVMRHGRFGDFVACSGYPTCKYHPPKGEKVPTRTPVKAHDGAGAEGGTSKATKAMSNTTKATKTTNKVAAKGSTKKAATAKSAVPKKADTRSSQKST